MQRSLDCILSGAETTRLGVFPDTDAEIVYRDLVFPLQWKLLPGEMLLLPWLITRAGCHILVALV